MTTANLPCTYQPGFAESLSRQMSEPAPSTLEAYLRLSTPWQNSGKARSIANKVRIPSIHTKPTDILIRGPYLSCTGSTRLYSGGVLFGQVSMRLKQLNVLNSTNVYLSVNRPYCTLTCKYTTMFTLYVYFNRFCEKNTRTRHFLMLSTVAS